MVVGKGGPVEDEGRRVLDQERWGDVVPAEILYRRISNLVDV